MRIEDRVLPAAGAATVRELDRAVELDTAAGMLGLPGFRVPGSGFRVLAAAVFDGELQVQVETTADLVGCPSCSAVAVLHDRRLRLVRDLPAGGRPDAAVLVEAGVALPAPGVSDGHVLRADRGGPTEGCADRAGSGRGVPPGRAGRALGGPGRCRSGELGGVPGPTLARSRWMDHRPRAGLSRALTAVGDLTSFREGEPASAQCLKLSCGRLWRGAGRRSWSR